MKPKGTDLLAVLVELLSRQEGVTTKYEIESGDCLETRKAAHA